jgi:hypothetical protein
MTLKIFCANRQAYITYESTASFAPLQLQQKDGQIKSATGPMALHQQQRNDNRLLADRDDDHDVEYIDKIQDSTEESPSNEFLQLMDAEEEEESKAAIEMVKEQSPINKNFVTAA